MLMKPESIKPDYNLYLVTDSGMTGRENLVRTVGEAVKGGVTVVQYREKTASTAAMIREAKAILALLKGTPVPLIINDRVDVALAVGADGVHLGHNDMDPVTARKIMGPDAVIGYSVESWQDLDDAERLDVDYYGVSPIFATPTKTDTGKPWGIEGMQKLRGLTGRPLVAIGGMNTDTISETLMAGADGVAVVSAICASENPLASARELHQIVTETKYNHTQ
ncbi:thiamine phosphate synthase [Natronogracilivirgula saccharolytica]|uniref:Thiamine-phosphate synthase n=2 Tax=Natronogracilivirga saccharolytica TaxID=2812953 RepID=A0A8J7RPZ1_9BACT|nr:thiamine phosphate synthase [Natronogracilivirga saccharolytica]